MLSWWLLLSLLRTGVWFFQPNLDTISRRQITEEVLSSAVKECNAHFYAPELAQKEMPNKTQADSKLYPCAFGNRNCRPHHVGHQSYLPVTKGTSQNMVLQYRSSMTLPSTEQTALVLAHLLYIPTQNSVKILFF